MIQEFTPEDLLGPLNETERRRSPRLLFVAGDECLFRAHPRVAVVGSRKASPEGLNRALRFSRMLVQRGAIVVSGLAEGIDTAAHRGAINGGGRTIGVIGTPLNKAYPKSNESLQREMMEKHAVISQFAEGCPTSPRNFPIRNALMALVSDASVIVEASETSGALSQGWEALRLGRPLFIMDSVFARPSLKWPHEMLQYGAQRLSDDNIEAFFEVFTFDKARADALAF